MKIFSLRKNKTRTLQKLKICLFKFSHKICHTKTKFIITHEFAKTYQITNKRTKTNLTSDTGYGALTVITWMIYVSINNKLNWCALYFINFRYTMKMYLFNTIGGSFFFFFTKNKYIAC